ncbi:MAG: FAD-binding protein [Thermoplasmatota archaeon]
MAIKQSEIDQLIARLGRENVLTSEADLLVYSTDIGSPPAIIDLLVNRKADVVARCHDIDDVATVVKFCNQHRIPMTPRAAATNALGGAVPKRGGCVIDLTPMSRGISIDEADATVTVDAGVVIKDLMAALADVGLALPVYPTSANAATIGGFVAMDGHGIQSTKYGKMSEHVVEVTGVDMDGRPFAHRSAANKDLVLGLGGSTGIITSVTIQCVEATKEVPAAFAVASFRDLQALVEELQTRFPVNHILFHNADFFALRNEAAGVRKNPFGTRHGVIVGMPEADFNANADRLASLATRHNGELLDEKVAASEWDGRFFPIRAKKLGPSLVAGEVYVPLEKAAQFMRELKDEVVVSELSMEGHVTKDGEVYFFIFALDDERRSTYPLGWGTSARILWKAKKLGGRAYHCGVWLQAQAKSVFGATRYKRLKTLKQGGDRRLLMNPGMVFPMPAPVPEFTWKASVLMPVPAPSLGLQLAMGDPMLIAQDKMMGYRRGKSLGVKAAEVAADMARSGFDFGKHTDLIWGADLPSAQAIPNPGRLPMTQTVRGKLVLAKAYATGKIVDPWTLKSALDVADPDVAEVAAVCPEMSDIQPLLDSFRRAVSAEGVELDVKTVEIVEEVVEVADSGDAGGPKLDIEAIKEQAKNTPEAEKAWVVAADCIVCNGCESACPTDAAIVTDIARVDRDLCIADGGCFDACPTGAIRPGEEDQSTSAGWPEGSRLAGKFGA